MNFPVYYGLDLAASLLLALAATCRASVYGMHFTGAVSLGLLAGLSSPVLRDILLGFGSVAPLHDPLYATTALLGGLGGRALAHWRAPSVFRGSEALSLGLATALGASHALVLGFGPVGCILLGLGAGTVGGVVRDVCLGDTPQAFEREFYVTAAAMGAMLVLALNHLALPSTFQVLAAAWSVWLLRMLGYRREQGRGDIS